MDSDSSSPSPHRDIARRSSVRRNRQAGDEIELPVSMELFEHRHPPPAPVFASDSDEEPESCQFLNYEVWNQLVDDMYTDVPPPPRAVLHLLIDTLRQHADSVGPALDNILDDVGMLAERLRYERDRVRAREFVADMRNMQIGGLNNFVRRAREVGMPRGTRRLIVEFDALLVDMNRVEELIEEIERYIEGHDLPPLDSGNDNDDRRPSDIPDWHDFTDGSDMSTTDPDDSDENHYEMSTSGSSDGEGNQASPGANDQAEVHSATYPDFGSVTLPDNSLPSTREHSPGENTNTAGLGNQVPVVSPISPGSPSIFGASPGSTAQSPGMPDISPLSLNATGSPSSSDADTDPQSESRDSLRSVWIEEGVALSPQSLPPIDEEAPLENIDSLLESLAETRRQSERARMAWGRGIRSLETHAHQVSSSPRERLPGFAEFAARRRSSVLRPGLNLQNRREAWFG